MVFISLLFSLLIKESIYYTICKYNYALIIIKRYEWVFLPYTLFYIHFLISFFYLWAKENHLANVVLLFGIVNCGAPLSRGTQAILKWQISLWGERTIFLNARKKYLYLRIISPSWNEARDNTLLFACWILKWEYAWWLLR